MLILATMKNVILIAIFLLSVNVMVDAYEYCKDETLKKICRPGKMHLECGAPELSTDYECQRMAPLLPITKKVKRFLLDLHNGWRDKVASGNEIGGKEGKTFQIATRMRELIWDNELNFLASNQVKRGKQFKVDCVASKRLNFVSQITVRSPHEGFKGKQDIASVFDVMLEILMPAYETKSSVPDPTAMAANCTSQPGRYYRYCNYFVCNYDFDNKPFEIIYQPGTEAASDCAHWGAQPSKQWPHLCTNTGEIFKYVSISPDHPFGLG
ncbi:uncharacterized protein LOC119635816 [Glossina fuscipes]|uniref:Uncharacterized protein LOC119635816 n=1 Tax=Glossina fuscipes TaxID=7396 RepID=A0A9C5YWD9_9MUSC|nr:uncharacterized protein LOC119635816 [Glossina fuscipes]